MDKLRQLMQEKWVEQKCSNRIGWEFHEMPGESS